jgi:hypothetical protein
MPSCAIAGVACLLAPASTNDGITHAAHAWMSAVVTDVSEVTCPNMHAPAEKTRAIEIRAPSGLASIQARSMTGRSQGAR